MRKRTVALVVSAAMAYLAIGAAPPPAEPPAPPTHAELLTRDTLRVMAALRARGYDERLGRRTGAVAKAVVILSRRYGKAGITAPVILAVAEVESHFRPSARSNFHAVGIMQLTVATAASLDTEHRTLSDPVTSLQLGTMYLAQLHEGFVAGDLEDRGDLHLTVLAYNWGPTRVRRALRGRDTLTLAYYDKFRRSLATWQEAGL